MIVSARSSDTSLATGMGWNGDPFQHPVLVEAPFVPHSNVLAFKVATSVPSTWARPVRTATPLSF